MKIKMNAKSIILCSLFGILGVQVQVLAQDKKEGNIQNDDIILEKERKIVLQPQISRNFEPLTEIENAQKGRKMKYEFFDRRWETANKTILTTSVIGPRTGDELVSSFGPKFKNLVKIGAGNFGHTVLNGHFGFNPKETQFHGLYINHDANRRGPVAGANSGRNENEVKAYSKTFTGQYLLDGQISFRRTGNNYYGRDEKIFDGSGTIRDLAITYNKFNYAGSISNAKKDAKFDYIATSGLTYLSTNYNTREWIWDSKIQSILHVNDNLSAYLVGEMNMSENTFGQTNRRELYRIKPSFLYKNNRLSVTAGINLANEKDRLLGVNKTRLFPIVKLDVKPTDFIHVFVGLGGETYFNSLNQFVGENNWMAQQVNLRNTVQTSNIYGGVKGSNERNLDFEMKVSYSEFSDLAFFVPATDSTRFNIAYAGGDKKVQVLNLSGQINYQTFDKVLSILKYDYNQFTNINIADGKAISRPLLSLSFTNSITFKDRIIVSPDLFYIGGLYGMQAKTGKSVKMDDIIDLNLKVNYLITKKFNASVSANNLLGKEYQRYLNYATQGLNYTVGVAYSF
ncbi:hypothetical protein U0R10_03055 [Aquirufa sp. OSTEICH-129V]|uniref:TonB-dependent receptor n=1 Tax=Aquirufa avitistagni TaxID=3104728 RepID=A0ABW6D9J0_9BACT